ncbi:hypothetical protein ACI784_15200 [Geodermatophilus sp. SYSU D01186]
MSAPAVLVPHFPTAGDQSPADDGLTLLMDMLVSEPPAGPRVHVPHVRGARRAALRAQLEDWVQRAANWGAGPQGAWRAW